MTVGAGGGVGQVPQGRGLGGEYKNGWKYG